MAINLNNSIAYDLNYESISKTTTMISENKDSRVGMKIFKSFVEKDTAYLKESDLLINDAYVSIV
jgi:hypothetical protein